MKEREINGIWYLLDIDEQEAMVVKSQGEEYAGDITIPSSFFHEGITYSVTKIGNKAFYWCFRLTSITIPDTIKKIESYSFEGCYDLYAVHVNSIETWCKIEFDGIYSRPLDYARNLYIKGELVTELTIPGTVKTINNYTFLNCELESVTILEGVTKIGESAFENCCNLTSVLLPDSVENIGKSAFASCRNLKTITIANGVLNIDDKAFYECNNLETIIGGNNVRCIGSDTFYECYRLTSIDSFSNIESIGNSAFYNCRSLEFIFPSNLSSIGDRAFYKCGFDSITIPKNVTNIGKCVFKECFHEYNWDEFSLTVDKENPKYDSRDNCNAIIETSSNTLIVGCNTTIIPKSVTTIGDDAFSFCKNLYSIDIPNSVTHIGKSAFSHCYKLCSVTIPDSVVYIGGSAFSDCVKLSSVEINNLESWCNIDFEGGGNPLGTRMFQNSIFLELNGNTISELLIPNTVTAIKNHTFEGCYLTSVILPKSVTSIGLQAFCSCRCLKSISIPNSVTTIGRSAFNNCISLTYIVTPKNVINIEEGAFANCEGITYITILGDKTNISERAFAKCKNLKDVYCYAEEPIHADNAFTDLNLAFITLHVPSNSIEKYKDTTPWSKFGNIEPLK